MAKENLDWDTTGSRAPWPILVTRSPLKRLETSSRPTESNRLPNKSERPRGRPFLRHTETCSARLTSRQWTCGKKVDSSPFTCCRHKMEDSPNSRRQLHDQFQCNLDETNCQKSHRLRGWFSKRYTLLVGRPRWQVLSCFPRDRQKRGYQTVRLPPKSPNLNVPIERLYEKHPIEVSRKDDFLRREIIA